MVLLSGGFGSGKTLGLGLKLLQLKTMNPHAPGLLMAQTWRALWSITLRRLMGFLRRTLPRDRLPKVMDKSGECFLDFGDGIPIFLRSAHDVACFDGLDVGWALGDEVRHWEQKSHQVLLGRVRVPCELPQVGYASTPSMGWMYDEFATQRKDRQLIVAPTWENAKNLAPGFIENMRLSYSRRMQRVVIEGRFEVMEGAVYEAFDSDPRTSQWLVDYDIEENKWRKTYLAVDPGFRRSAWLWVHERKATEWVVVDEMMPDGMSDDACVQRVNDRGLPIDEIWCDPAAEQTQSTLDLDTIEMLKGIKTRASSPIRYVTGPFRSISYGIDKTRTLLGDPEEGQPIRMYFAKQLIERERQWERGIVKDLSAYRYPEMKDAKPVLDVPLKDGRTDHSNDALRNFAVGMWLTSPLRHVDPKLKQLQQAGYKQAA